MKKSLLILLAIFLTTSIFTSCDKDNPQLLSDFVIGTWQSQELVLGDSPFGTFTAVIKTNNKYVLTFTMTTSDGTQSITSPETGYSIDEDKSQIIITQPDFEPNDGVTPTDTQTFDVAWTVGGNTMTWTPIGGSDAPTLQWTRGD